MKKKIILFFLAMMILTDDRRLSVQLTERAPIVDTYGRIFGFDDHLFFRYRASQSDYFLLNEARFLIRIDIDDPGRTKINLDLFDHSGPSGFSKIIERTIPLN